MSPGASPVTTAGMDWRSSTPLATYRPVQKYLVSLRPQFGMSAYRSPAAGSILDARATDTAPVAVASRDMFYGAGGPDHAPRHMEFRFLEEDKSGSNPKYTVIDADGVKWKMKLDEEARPVRRPEDRPGY